MLSRTVTGGFAVAVPGLLTERISKHILNNKYIHIVKYGLVLQLGGVLPSQQQELLQQAEKIQVHARVVQEAASVKSLARLIVLDRGLARKVRTPRRWKCPKHSKECCQLHAGTCAPISIGAGQYRLLWGIYHPCPPPPGDDEHVDGYDTTPLAEIYKILEEYHEQGEMADTSNDEGWYKGGVMNKISSSMKRDAPDGVRIALKAHEARATTGNPLRFVWDVVGTDAKLDSMKYVLDAAREPLVDIPDFEQVYGMPRYLTFVTKKQRTPIETNLFEGIY